MRGSKSSAFTSLVIMIVVSGFLMQFAGAAGPELVSADVDDKIEQLITAGNIKERVGLIGEYQSNKQ